LLDEPTATLTRTAPQSLDPSNPGNGSPSAFLPGPSRTDEWVAISATSKASGEDHVAERASDAAPPEEALEASPEELIPAKAFEALAEEASAEDTIRDEQISAIQADEGGALQEVRIRVSSKHLTLASHVFVSILQPGFQTEDELHLNGRTELPLPEDDPVALLFLLYAIHGRWREVPHNIDLRTLTEISILVLIAAISNDGFTRFFAFSRFFHSTTPY